MTVTVVWLVILLLLIFFVKRGFERGRYREFVWSFVLVVSAFAVPGVVDFMIGLINVVAAFITDRLNGATKGNNKWELKPDRNGLIALQTFAFVVMASLGYLYGRTKAVPVPGKPTAKPRPVSAKSLLGAIIAFFNGVFFLNFIYNNITKVSGGEIKLGMLNNVKIGVPQIGGNGAPQIGGGEIRFTETTERPGLLTWLNYLPLLMGGLLLFFFLFGVLSNPPTNKDGSLDMSKIIFGLLGAAIMLLIGITVFLNKA
jgi:hypothetical protein